MGAVRAFLRLLRWLGPWADPSKAPSGALRREVSLEPEAPGDRPLKLWIYAPADAPPIGSYLVAHGLNLDGPADPRLDRFLRILANAGFLVCAPLLPDYTQLLLRPEVARDLERALRLFVRLPERPRQFRPGVFSVSFGSYPALRIASGPTTSELIGALVVFGGYADPNTTLRFNIGIRPPGARAADATSLPAIAMNLLDGFECKPEEMADVLAGWYEFARATWAHPEFREPERWQPVAEAIAARLKPDEAYFFLLGCGLVDGAQQEFLEALDRWDRLASVDPRPHLSGLKCPVFLFHSRWDDVVPCEESAKLLEAMPAHARARRYVTGLYEHGQRSPGLQLLRQLPRMAREAATLLRMLHALVRAGRST